MYLIDGVGFKILLSEGKITEGFDLGVDLVSHLINDILVQGASNPILLRLPGVFLNRDELKIYCWVSHQNKYGNIPT